MKTLVIAEKPSVAQDIVKALTPVSGKFEKHDDHFESDTYVVTSAVGHLVEIQAPEQFDVKRGKWSFANLPVIPPFFDLKPVDKTKTRLNAVVKQAKRKDVSALVKTAQSMGYEPLLLNAVEARNQAQKQVIFNKVKAYFKGNLKGKTIALWGLAFKPNTDDMREAPSRVVIKNLLQRGAHVTAYDPVAGHAAVAALTLDCAGQAHGLKNFKLVDHDMDALHDVDALMVLTEWKNFHNPDFQAMKLSMRTPYILDGRNLYNPDALADLGIAYQGVGRRNELVKLAVDPVSNNMLTVDA